MVEDGLGYKTCLFVKTHTLHTHTPFDFRGLNLINIYGDDITLSVMKA